MDCVRESHEMRMMRKATLLPAPLMPMKGGRGARCFVAMGEEAGFSA